MDEIGVPAEVALAAQNNPDSSEANPQVSQPANEDSSAKDASSSEEQVVESPPPTAPEEAAEVLPPTDSEDPAPETKDSPAETSDRLSLADGMAKHLDEYTTQLTAQLIEDSIKRGMDPLEAEVQARQKVDKVKSYFLLKDGEKGITPLERVAQVYDYLDLTGGDTADVQGAITEHSYEVTERAFDQHFENPEQYVSHGFDHSINVADYTRGIIEQNPQIIASMIERYGISEGTARFMIENVALLHDAGYPDLDGRSKAVHAIEGAEIVSTQKMRELYSRMIPDLPQDKRDFLLHDLRDSIMYHNADTVQRAYEAKIVTSRGEFLVDSGNVLTVLSFFNGEVGESSEKTTVYVKDEAARQAMTEEFGRLGILGEGSKISVVVLGEGKSLKGRNIDLAESGDALAGLEFRQVDSNDSPMHALIRIADNMDIRTDRFSDIQRTAAFKEIYTAFGDGGDVSQTLQLFEKLSSIPVQGIPAETYRATVNQAKEVLSGTLTPEQAQAYEKQIAESSSASQIRDLYKQIVIDGVIKNHPDLPEDDSSVLRRIAVTQNTESMRHFGGCEAISGFELKGNTFTVRVDSAILTKLNQVKVTEKSLDGNGDIRRVNVGVGEYQIWRLKEAYKSISVDGKSIDVVIIDENGSEIVSKDEMPEF